jgi:hypothetical protein
VYRQVRDCDAALCFADFIVASGQLAAQQAEHMTAPSDWEKSVKEILANRAVPHLNRHGVSTPIGALSL